MRRDAQSVLITWPCWVSLGSQGSYRGIPGRRSPIGGAVCDEMFVLSQNTEMRPLAWMSNPEVPVWMQLLRPHRDLIRPCPLQPQPEHGVFRRITTSKLKVCCLSDRDIRRRTAPAVHVHAKGRRAGCCGSPGRCVVSLSAGRHDSWAYEDGQRTPRGRCFG